MENRHEHTHFELEALISTEIRFTALHSLDESLPELEESFKVSLLKALTGVRYSEFTSLGGF
jgi:hypothetical protein